MTTRVLGLLILGALVFAACGGDKPGPDGEGTAARAECTEELPAPADIVDLPPNFPVLDEAILTDSNQAGPSLVVEGFFTADLEAAFPDYEAAFEAAGYDITKDEQEANDAEIFFAGDSTTGQVNMFAECDGRTKLRITIRPD